MKDYYKVEDISREEVSRWLDEYYDERGWNTKTGTPTPQKLRKLDIP